MTDEQLQLWLEELDNLPPGRPVVRGLCEPLGWAMDIRGPVIDRLLGPPACPWPLRGDEHEGRE